MTQSNLNSFSSRGNLIISGEYFVLMGARALVVPLKFGQIMTVENAQDDKIDWKVFEEDKAWFHASFLTDGFKIISSNDEIKASKLKNLFEEINSQNSELFESVKGFQFTSHIQFNSSWGWGSSATLISNLSAWANINPYKLNQKISSGSGYDIAASMSSTPIFYELINKANKVEPVGFNPVFKENIYFIFLGKKQNTDASILTYQKSIEKNKHLTPLISRLSEAMAIEENIIEFMKLMSEHEELISKTINLPVIKNQRFKDFAGEIKSLGAWGGDFVMAVSHMDEISVKKFFENKGLKTIFKFDEIILSQ